mgnify:CR=1 FL=1
MFKSNSGFHGVYPMMYTFFDQNGDVSEEPVRACVNSMVQHKVQGLAVLGLASEVNKLSRQNRIKMLELVCETNAKRIPISVTVSENSVSGQIEFGKIAIEYGADWLVLQPPPVSNIDEGQLVEFFSSVIRDLNIPIGIQNAPHYLGIGLSHAGIYELMKRHDNFVLIKTECNSSDIAKLAEATEGRIDIFNGVGGSEFPDVLRGGAVGIIPGGESFDMFARIYAAMRNKREDEAEKLYRETLPLIVFLDNNIDHLVTYGKIAIAKRLGIDAGSPPIPATICSKFGLEVIQRYIDALPKL